MMKNYVAKRVGYKIKIPQKCDVQKYFFAAIPCRLFSVKS